MKLLETLGHMPFSAGSEILFCHSDGAVSVTIDRTETARSLGVPPQVSIFQPWRLARLREGKVELLEVLGMPTNSPTKVFCNPVFADGYLSFMYGGTLWACPLGDGNKINPTAIKSGIFSGFFRHGVSVYTSMPIQNQQASVIFDASGTSLAFPLDNIVRVIPNGPDGLIVTGFNGPDFRSFLWQPGEPLKRITVNGGEDVYKCCIVGDDVIYAKRSAPEGAHLHIDPVELTPQ